MGTLTMVSDSMKWRQKSHRDPNTRVSSTHEKGLMKPANANKRYERVRFTLARVKASLRLQSGVRLTLCWAENINSPRPADITWSTSGFATMVMTSSLCPCWEKSSSHLRHLHKKHMEPHLHVIETLPCTLNCHSIGETLRCVVYVQSKMWHI